MLEMINQDEDMKISFKCSVAHQLLLKCTRSWIVFEQHCPQYDLKVRSSVYTQEGFSLSSSDAKHNFDELWRIIIWFFLCPQLIWMLFVFLLRVYCIAPRWSTFQGVSRNVDVIFVKDFANSIDVLLCLTIFLVLEPNLILQRSCLFKSNCWNEIREISVFIKKYFWNSSFFGQRPNTRHSM